ERFAGAMVSARIFRRARSSSDDGLPGALAPFILAAVINGFHPRAGAGHGGGDAVHRAFGSGHPARAQPRTTTCHSIGSAYWISQPRATSERSARGHQTNNLCREKDRFEVRRTEQ